jgi:hypothetical protein
MAGLFQRSTQDGSKWKAGNYECSQRFTHPLTGAFKALQRNPVETTKSACPSCSAGIEHNMNKTDALQLVKFQLVGKHELNLLAASRGLG